MKKIIFLFTTIVCFAFSANSQTKDNVIKINIFSPIVKTFNFSYERSISDKSSLQLGLAITGASIGETKFSGLQITPEYRFYLSSNEAPAGVYAAPFLRYSNLSIKEEFTDSEADLTGFGLGLVLGKQWLFGGNENIALDVFLGPSYNSTSLTLKSGNEDNFEFGGFDGFGLRFGVNFGFAF